MRFTLLFVTALMGVKSWAYEGGLLDYYCSIGNVFREGLSKEYSAEMYSEGQVTGYFAGKSFTFSDSQPRFDRKTGIMTWESHDKQWAVQMQLPGPYDGLQDSQWGEIRKGTKKQSFTCYPNH